MYKDDYKTPTGHTSRSSLSHSKEAFEFLKEEKLYLQRKSNYVDLISIQTHAAYLGAYFELVE